MVMMKTANALAAAVLLSGCMSMPQEELLPVPLQHAEMPARWPATQGLPRDVLNEDWWLGFGSSELNRVVEQARAQSLDMQGAVARVAQARAQAEQARANASPELSAELSTARTRTLGHGDQGDGQRWRGALTASYELDLWGRLQSGSTAAQALWQASVYDSEALQLSVTAAVANAWLQCVALGERVSMAQQSLQIAERLLQLVEAKARLGAATSLDLAQQRGLVAAQQRTLAAVEQQEAVARASLAVLSGHWTVQAPEQGSVFDLAVPQIQPGAPTELLTRRPDIARAEAQLQAAGANLQAARAAMLPRLSLSAGVVSEPESLRRLLDRPLLSLALGLTAPIFDAGRLASQRDAAVARRQELLASYRQAIMAAYGDVQIALDASHGAQQQEQAQAQELAQARRALGLAQSRYRAGAETMLTLLETQRASFVAHDLAIQMRLERLQASVALYKALGGGWQLT